MAQIERRFVCGASISKRGLFLLEGVVTISFPLLFCGVATPGVVVVDFLGWGAFVGTFAFAFGPLEEGEEGFLAVVRRDGFFWVIPHHCCQALCDCACAPVCLGES